MSAPFSQHSQLKNPVCVFCGASPGSSPVYARAATALGEALAAADIPVVYGGGRRGIMGVVSQSTLTAGGYVHGILPRALVARASENTSTSASTSGLGSAQTGTPAVTSLSDVKSAEGAGHDLLADDFGGRLSMEVVGSMHERKAKMAQLSTGGFIVLPGGYGTFEELLEMVTWNQLGIHTLPIIVLNIGNFFTPLMALFTNAVDAGFIKTENLSLLQVVDLPGGSEANADDSRAGDWGAVAIQALENWSLPSGAGYGLTWKDNDKTPSSPLSSASKPALFTTLRFTSPRPDAPTLPVTTAHLPLYSLHVGRLREAHTHFTRRDGPRVWGRWPGDTVLWDAVRDRLEQREREGPGDWRVRIVIHPGPRIEVEAVPAPADAGPFRLLPAPDRDSSPAAARPLYYDIVDTTVPSGKDLDYRLYKTERRDVYDAASARAAARLGYDNAHPEVLLHTSTRLLETNTSNIAILMPTASAGEEPEQERGWEWVTPALDAVEEAPLLNGVMRRHLISQGIVHERKLSPDDWVRALHDRWRVIGFNGLRGVWEAELSRF